MATPSLFGQVLRRLREAKGWSQSALAAEAGLSSGYISLLETGQRGARPSQHTLVALIHALNCDPARLFEAAGRTMPLDDIRRLQATFERTPEVIRAIQRDRRLRPGEREALVELYARFTTGRP